jgi:hypothetical protein
MKVCNYTSIFKWYAIEKEDTVLYGQLNFCQELESSSSIILLDNETWGLDSLTSSESGLSILFLTESTEE